MKINLKSDRLLAVALVISYPLNAGTLNVPSDFPGSFHMDLLIGFAVWDMDPAFNSSGFIGDLTLITATNQILFSASAFDGLGGGAGTSNLTFDPTFMNVGVDLYARLTQICIFT